MLGRRPNRKAPVRPQATPLWLAADGGLTEPTQPRRIHSKPFVPNSLAEEARHLLPTLLAAMAPLLAQQCACVCGGSCGEVDRDVGGALERCCAKEHLMALAPDEKTFCCPSRPPTPSIWAVRAPAIAAPLAPPLVEAGARKTKGAVWAPASTSVCWQ